MYKVNYTELAIKRLKKLDRQTVAFIYAWIEKNLVGCENPRQHGKAPTANHSGEWRYRVGDYRLLAYISESDITILILEVGHRRDIYLS